MAFLLAALACAAETPPSVAQRANDFMATVPSEHSRSREEQQSSVTDRFTALRLAEAFAPSSTPEAEDADALFRAAQHAFFYTSDNRYLRNMRQSILWLEQGKAANAQHYTMLHRALIQSRQFDEADQLRARHGTPRMTALPERDDTASIPKDAPSVWRFIDQQHIARLPLDPARYSVIVVAHPNCRYTQRAAAAIESDTALSAVFGASALWLAPQDANLDAAAFWQWQQEHPSMPVALVHHAETLPQITRWATPTFYFLRGGRVVAEVVGWPKGGRRDELLAAAQTVGLVTR